MRRSGRTLVILLTALAVGACSSGPETEPPAGSRSPVPNLAPTPVPDRLAPSVLARAPAPAGTIATHGSVLIIFSEPVSGVDQTHFQLLEAAGGSLPATVAYTPTTHAATLTPALPLAIGASYTVALAAGIRDQAGNGLPAESWTIAASNLVSFAAGTYTGYQFGAEPHQITAIRRMTLSAPSSAPAEEHRVVNGQDYLLISGGGLGGYWVHGGRDGVSSDDFEAPITPLPRCDYLDLPTARPRPTAWATTVLDTLFALPSSYQPTDLVDTGQAGLNAGHLVRSLVVTDLAAMVAAAKADGARLAVQSSYRSYSSQVATFNGWVYQVGYQAALRVAARPGHSEHQLGTAIDFRSVNGPSPWSIPDWAVTSEGAWMSANAWRFGWIVSYPRGTFGVSCYDYEPWHYRYVGREIAGSIHEAGITEREWLWARGYGVR